MKTKLSALVILAYCLLSATALQAGPLTSVIIMSTDPVLSGLPPFDFGYYFVINVPNRQSLTITHLSLKAGAPAFATVGVEQGGRAASALVVDVSTPPSEQAVTIPGPARVGVQVQAEGLALTRAYMTYKLINNK